MAEYVRVTGTDVYLRVFEQEEVVFINGSPRLEFLVEMDLARDFADARAVCGGETLPATEYAFTFEGQQTVLKNQTVRVVAGTPVIWGMWGDDGAETV